MRPVIFLATACLVQLVVAASDEKNIVCYFGSWCAYRRENGKLDVEKINSSLCTHLIYAFVGIDGCKVKILDEWQDLAENGGKDGYTRFNALRESDKKLKTLVAIGGWNEGSKKYSDMASNPSCRTEFIQDALAFVKKHKFDGFDLDWEYPADSDRGGMPADVANFDALIKEMSEVFGNERFLLSAAVGASKNKASKSYNIPNLFKYLDFVNLMTYDLHGSWESKTGIHSPLYGTGINEELSVDYIVEYWLSEGGDPKKLNLGIPFYGRTFTLANSTVHGINAPGHSDRAKRPGVAGNYTGEPGFLGYNEICEMERDKQLNVVYDKESHAPFGYHGDQWVGFDNVQSVTEKAEYIKNMKLGGAMIWSIETDDFNGNCGEPWPLLKAINAVLRNEIDLSEAPKHPMTTQPRMTPSLIKSTMAPSATVAPPATMVPPAMESTVEHFTMKSTMEPSTMNLTMAPEIPTVIVHTTQGPAVTHAPNITTLSSHESGQICKNQTKTQNAAQPGDCGFYQCVAQLDGTFRASLHDCQEGLCYNFEKDACLRK